MISCHDVTQLISLSLDRRLNFLEKMALKTHLAVCGQCRAYHQQLQALHEATGGFTDFLDANGDHLPQLPPDSHQRIIAAMKSEFPKV